MLAGELIDRTKHIRLAHRSIFISNTAPSNQRNSLPCAKKRRRNPFSFSPQLPTLAAQRRCSRKRGKKKSNNCQTAFPHAWTNEICILSCRLIKFRTGSYSHCYYSLSLQLKLHCLYIEISIFFISPRKETKIFFQVL
jgi:hypothetical protein